jgi:Protein of unknown function (DUF3572)
MQIRQPALSREQAESLAIQGLQHIAGDSELLARFLALSGIDPQDLREAASSPAFLSGVMDFFMGDEPALLAFAASIGEAPETIAAARAALSHDSGAE